MYSMEEAERARMHMWASLIPGYQEAPRNEKKKLKQEYRSMQLELKPFNPFAIFDDCPKQLSNAAVACKAPPRKGTENMYVEQNMTVAEKTTEDTRREHFLEEISKIFRKKDTEIEEKYGVSRPKGPSTPKEMVEWIKSGEFSFIKGYDPEDDDTWCRYESPIHGLRWTKVKEDKKGYDAAYKLLCDERNKFINEVWAEVEPANFIKILEKFEKSKLH